MKKMRISRAPSLVDLKKEDFPLWPFPIEQPYEGPMLGNTKVGLMLWGGENNTIELNLTRADFWSRQGGAEWEEGQSYEAIRRVLEAGDAEGLRAIFKPTEMRPTLLPLGHITLRFPKEVTLHSAKLDIQRGQITINYHTNISGWVNFSIFIDWPTGMVVLGFPVDLPVKVSITPAWDLRDNATAFTALGASAPYIDPQGAGFVQTLPHDPSAAVAIASKNNFFFISSHIVPQDIDTQEAFTQTLSEAKEAAELGIIPFRARTAERWANYWKSTPRVRLPNPTLQRLYEFGMYKFGAYSSDEPDSVACTLQGPWYDDRTFPPWSGDYHFNINLQECYWPAFRGNHLAHLKPVFDMLERWTPRLRENARIFVGIDDGLMLSHAVDDTGKAISAGFWTGMMDHGSTLWMGDLYWQYYRFTGDLQWLRSTAVPFMKGAFNVFFKMLDQASDGTLSLPVGPSPEYRGADLDAWGRNASFQLAAAHRLTENLVDAANLLGETPDPRWERVLNHLPKAALVPYANGQAIGLWEGLALEESHRHHSHMAAIFPFDTIDCEAPEWRPIIENTYRHWIQKGSSAWSGWCVPWASILHTRVGNAEMAEMLLEIWERFYTNQGHGTLHDANPTGFSLLGITATPDPSRPPNEIMQLDAGGSCIKAIFEMLMHERRGITYLFRGAPKRWRNVSFQNMLAPGGILVSAARKKNGVYGVTLQAQQNPASIRLANPWPNQTLLVYRGSSRQYIQGDILEFHLQPNEFIDLRLDPKLVKHDAQ